VSLPLATKALELSTRLATLVERIHRGLREGLPLESLGQELEESLALLSILERVLERLWLEATGGGVEEQA